MTEAMFRLRRTVKMANSYSYDLPIKIPNTYKMDFTIDFLNDLCDSHFCPKTGRKITYDKYTGEPLDAETLIPIDNFVDFSNKPIL